MSPTSPNFPLPAMGVASPASWLSSLLVGVGSKPFPALEVAWSVGEIFLAFSEVLEPAPAIATKIIKITIAISPIPPPTSQNRRLGNRKGFGVGRDDWPGRKFADG